MTSNKQANNKNAKYYDIVYSDMKDTQTTDAELEIIKELVPNVQARILDLGCGSGRHLIPLSRQGYQITGIDESESMVSMLQEKDPEAQVVCVSLDQFKSPYKFDLALLMWNALNEMAWTDADLQQTLQKIATFLNPQGKILINSGTLNEFDPAQMDFTLQRKFDGKVYQVFWKVLSYDAQQHISTSEERIVITEPSGKVIETSTAVITQKWWSEQELIAIADQAGLSSKKLGINENEELYLVLTLHAL